MREKAKILIVEDEVPLAMLLTHLLFASGFDGQVVHARNRAMELVQEKSFDLILLEMDSLRLDAIEICKEIRTVSRCVPMIFITDKPENYEIEIARFRAICMTKPIEAADFVFQIASQLKTSKAAEQLNYA